MNPGIAGAAPSCQQSLHMLQEWEDARQEPLRAPGVTWGYEATPDCWRIGAGF